MKRVFHSAMVSLALLLAACAQPVGAPPSSPGPEAPTPKFGGVLNTIGEDFTDFDMVYQGKTGANVNYHGLAYDGLIAFKRGPDVEFVSQVLEPQLAERWEVSSDARAFTYHLRKGVKYADVPPVNGREFTSADVKWSLEYYSRTGEFADRKFPPSQTREIYEGLEAIETPDRNTVRLRFKDPFVPFLNYSASEWMPIAARETFDPQGALPRITSLVGTGPFIQDLEQSQKDTRVVFRRNPTYWDAPKPYVDSIRRLIIPDVSTQQAAFQTQQVDLLISSTAYEFTTARTVTQSNPRAVMAESVSPGYHGLMLSQLRGPMKDIRVRRAISLAMDREEYNNVLFGGKAPWVLNGAWPGLFTDAETRELLRTDLAEARRLLAEAGYGSGLTLEFLPVGAQADTKNQLAQAQLKRAGIEVNFVSLPREQNRAKLYAGDYDIFHLVGAGALGDGDFDGLQFSHYSTSAQNWSKIQDPELDKLILGQRQAADPPKRRELQRAVVRRIHEMAWNPGYTFRTAWAWWHPYVKNYGPHFTYSGEGVFVWLDK